MRGRFIAFEGIDGSGKSTAIKQVAGRLHETGHDIVTTREETDTFLGDAVRRSIADGLDALATTYLFLADRAQHSHQIRAHLSEGRHVLCDRYLHSTLAYQAVTLAGRMDDPAAFLRTLHEPVDLWPDHVLLFDVDPATAMARVQSRGKASRYERGSFLESVRRAYLDMAAADARRFQIIDAGQDLETMVSEAARVVAGWLAGPAR